MMSKENAIKSLVSMAGAEGRAAYYNILRGADKLQQVRGAADRLDSAIDIVSAIYDMSDEEFRAARSEVYGAMQKWV